MDFNQPGSWLGIHGKDTWILERVHTIFDLLSCDRIYHYFVLSIKKASTMNKLKEERIKAIQNIINEKHELMQLSIQCASGPVPKTIKKSISTARKLFGYTMRIRELEIQIRMIMAQPIPRYERGGLPFISESPQ